MWSCYVTDRSWRFVSHGYLLDRNIRHIVRVTWKQNIPTRNCFTKIVNSWSHIRWVSWRLATLWCAKQANASNVKLSFSVDTNLNLCFKQNEWFNDFNFLWGHQQVINVIYPNYFKYSCKSPRPALDHTPLEIRNDFTSPSFFVYNKEWKKPRYFARFQNWKHKQFFWIKRQLWQ